MLEGTPATMNIYSIYLAKNIKNQKIYVGFTKNLTNRILSHIKASRRKDAIKIKFYRAIKEYGENSFEWVEIFCSPDRDFTLNYAEKYFILQYDSMKNGYNMTPGGDCVPETIKRNKPKKIFQCPTCNNELLLLPWQEKRAKNHFCSQECKNKLKKYYYKIPCFNCGQIVTSVLGRVKKRAIFCSQKCRIELQKGKTHEEFGKLLKIQREKNLKFLELSS